MFDYLKNLNKQYEIENARLDTRIKRSMKSMSAYGISVFVLFIFFTSLGLYLLKSTTLNNSYILGNEIASRANVSIADFIDKQKEVLNIVSHYAKNEIKKSQDRGEIFDHKKFINDISTMIAGSFTPFRYKFYGCFNGYLVSSDSKHNTENINCSITNSQDPINYKRPSMLWYDVVERMKTSAKPFVSTDNVRLFLHNGANDGVSETIFTLATKINDEGDAIAFDFFSSKNPREIYLNSLPSDYAYYLLDKNGRIILFHNHESYKKNISVAKVQSFITPIFKDHIENMTGADIFEKNLKVIDPFGTKVHVYAHQDERTGWYTILTTPYEKILSDYTFIFNIFICIVSLFLIVELSMLYREFHLSRKIEMTTESLKVLGNSYHDIIRINFNTKCFHLLKSTDRMREALSSKKNTADLFAYLKTVIKEDEWDSFYENYSLASQEHLALNRILDMGHDFMIKDADGSYRWFNIRLLFDESLDIQDSILTIKLVDDDKLLEIEQHQLLKDALSLSHKNEEAKNVFFSNMSHDMRTPLNGIIGLCTIAQNHIDNKDRIIDVINKITSTSKQLLGLIDDILDIARPEKQLTLNRKKFNLTQSLNDCIDIFHASAKQEHKNFNVNYEIHHNALIGDFPKLRQILNNLLSNAFKYSNEGDTVTFSVREVVEQHLPQFLFEIKDTGIGMSQDFLKNLFIPYQREERMSNVKGTGLGMPIVKTLVHKMCGNIHVISEINKGTTFTITIPIEIDESVVVAENSIKKTTNSTIGVLDDKESLKAIKNDSQTHNDSPNISNIEDKPKANILKGLRILIAEDNELNMEIADDILSMKGAIISKAWNGQEALEQFKERGDEFDVILMDMRMPVMDGLQACAAIRALKNNEWAQKIPILAVTANAFAEDISATHATGMNAHISKPIDFNILEKTLTRLVHKRT